MKRSDCIAVFDSGVGGLSVLKELQGLLPNFEYVYCQDNAFYPYGTKTDKELIQRLTHLLPTLIQHTGAKILVVACNTASTIALNEIRQSVNVPVVGVVPAIKPASKISKSRVLGLLATEATVRRAYTDKLIADFAQDCTLIKIGTRKLVDLAEAKMRGETVSLKDIESELLPFFSNDKLDTVILACTHFDHLRDEFESVSPRPLHWLSSAEAVAAHTKTLVGKLALHGVKGSNTFISTQTAPLNLSLLEAYGFKRFEILD